MLRLCAHCCTPDPTHLMALNCTQGSTPFDAQTEHTPSTTLGHHATNPHAAALANSYSQHALVFGDAGINVVQGVIHGALMSFQGPQLCCQSTFIQILGLWDSVPKCQAMGQAMSTSCSWGVGLTHELYASFMSCVSFMR